MPASDCRAEGWLDVATEQVSVQLCGALSKARTMIEPSCRVGAQLHLSRARVDPSTAVDAVSTFARWARASALAAKVLGARGACLRASSSPGRGRSAACARCRNAGGRSCRCLSSQSHVSHGAGIPPHPALGGRHTLGGEGLGDLRRLRPAARSAMMTFRGGAEGARTTGTTPSGPLGGQGVLRAGSDQSTLVLSERGDDRSHQLARGSRRVHVHVEDDDAPARGGQPGHEVGEVEHRAANPVELGSEQTSASPASRASRALFSLGRPFMLLPLAPASVATRTSSHPRRSHSARMALI